MKYHIIPPANSKSSTSNSQVQIGIFNGSTRHWSGKATAWLREMRFRGLGCSGCHTLQIETGRQAAIFHLLVCEAMNPLPPLPANISDCFGSGCRFGDVVIADCTKSPPVLRVHQDFWAGPSDGDSHFEDTIMPLMEQMIASFSERGSAWAN